jgi:hypothetical protein
MRERRRAVVAALGWGLVLGILAPPAAAQAPAAAYVVLGGQGAVARAVVLAGTTAVAPQCPAIVVNGASQAMTMRAAPDTNFPILVCEHVLPASATSAAIGGQALPLPPAALKSIAVFGDTGCRLKADKAPAAQVGQAAHDPDEDEESSKFQDCNVPSDWPLAPMSATIANAKPDLVVHVGDYLYRESPCPSGDQGCQGSPYGDNWTTWAADFFTPAAPLLKAVPWIVARGNHEICKRSGAGYARLLDPTPAGRKLPPACVDLIDQYTVTVGGRAFIVLDSSDAPDACPQSGCNSAPYAAQFAAMKPAAATWLVTHRPIWGFTNSKRSRLASAPGGAPGDRLGLRPVDADIGQFALVEAGQLAHVVLVRAPGAEQADQLGKQHGASPCCCSRKAGDRPSIDCK